MIKITGGKHQRKQLNTISEFVRPTSAMKREAFFSIIKSYSLKNSYDFFSDKVFLDLFAGIGTMGLEAISRGIEYAIFYENNKEVIKVLKKNCKKFCNQNQYKIIKEDVANSNFEINFNKISIIYIDPPYHEYDITKLLIYLQNRVKKKSIIGVESSIKDTFKIPKKLKLIKQKKYGKTNISFLILA